MFHDSTACRTFPLCHFQLIPKVALMGENAHICVPPTGPNANDKAFWRNTDERE
jgi:hypothetical protein